MVPIVLEKKKYTYEGYLKTFEDKLRKFIAKKSLGEMFDAPCDVYLER